jgi:hypothetical protein
MNSREYTLWALKQWSTNYRGDLIGVTCSHVAKMSGFSRQQIHRVMTKLYQCGDVVRDGKFEHRYYPAIDGRRYNPQTEQLELFKYSESGRG